MVLAENESRPCCIKHSPTTCWTDVRANQNRRQQLAGTIAAAGERATRDAVESIVVRRPADHFRRRNSLSERPASWHREELSIAFSGDDGKTWTRPEVLGPQSTANRFRLSLDSGAPSRRVVDHHDGWRSETSRDGRRLRRPRRMTRLQAGAYGLSSATRRFDANGYVVLPGYVGGRQLEGLQSKIDQFIRNVVPAMPCEQVFFEDKQRPETLKQLQSLHEHDEYFADLFWKAAFPRSLPNCSARMFHQHSVLQQAAGR